MPGLTDEERRELESLMRKSASAWCAFEIEYPNTREEANLRADAESCDENVIAYVDRLLADARGRK